MLRFPAALTEDAFLSDYWQKQPLFLPSAVDGPKPSLTRNELGWLATLDDVESRIVFTDRGGSSVRYRSETGPFDEQYLTELPTRDWTLLVHDVEKHLPDLRTLLSYVPFIPDWRIDDLMVSFAAPGGGVGPHKDNYDVFLVQGTGIRDWRVTTNEVSANGAASSDLALLQEFGGESYECTRGDVLYLPPGVAHWGTAKRACLTYSIGMRAPQLSDLVDELPDSEGENPFFRDPDLTADEAIPGFISAAALSRAEILAGRGISPTTLGRYVTLTKDWLRPESADVEACEVALSLLSEGGVLEVHGMARIAWDARHVYVNGVVRELTHDLCKFVQRICASRGIVGPLPDPQIEAPLVHWMLENGAFELPETH